MSPRLIVSLTHIKCEWEFTTHLQANIGLNILHGPGGMTHPEEAR